METAKVDIQKLQLLNDRINQTIEALNQVRLSVHGLSHTQAMVPPGVGFGGMPFPAGYNYGVGVGFGAGYPQGLPTSYPGSAYGFGGGVFGPIQAHHQPYMPYGLGHTSLEDPYARWQRETFTHGRVAQTFPFAGAQISPFAGGQISPFAGQVGPFAGQASPFPWGI